MGRCKAGKVIKDGFTVRVEPVMYTKKGVPCKYCGGLQPNNGVGSFEVCGSSCPYYYGNAVCDCKNFVNECIHSGELTKYRLPERPDLVGVLEKASGKYFDGYTKEKLRKDPGLAVGFVRSSLIVEMVLWLKYVCGVSDEGIRFLFGLKNEEISTYEKVGIDSLVTQYIRQGKTILGGLRDVPDKEYEQRKSLPSKQLCFSDEQRTILQGYLSMCQKDVSTKYVTKYRTLKYPLNLISDLFHVNGLVIYSEFEDFLARNNVVDVLLTSSFLSRRQYEVLLMLYVEYPSKISRVARKFGVTDAKVADIRDKALKEVWKEFTYPVR